MSREGPAGWGPEPRLKAGRASSVPPCMWTADWLESSSQLPAGGGKMHVPMGNDGRKFKAFVCSGSG